MQGVDEIYEVHVDDEVLQVHICDCDMQVKQGEALKPDAIFYTDMGSYLPLLTGQLAADKAISSGLVRVEGEPGSLSRFLTLCGLPVSRAGATAIS